MSGIFSDKRKNNVLIFCLVLYSNLLNAQTFITTTYSTKDFMAHRLIWDATEDRYGRLWFANNDGVLRFDGGNWLLFPTPAPVRSLTFGNTGELFLTCTNDFGVLKFNTDGTSSFISLKKKLKSAFTSAEDGKVISVGVKTWFCFREQLVAVDGQGNYNVRLFETPTLLGAFTYLDKLYLNRAREGLGTFTHNTFTPILNGAELAGKTISRAGPYKGDLMIATAYDGLYKIHHNRLSRLEGEASGFSKKGIADISLLPGDKIAIATFHDGVQLFNADLSANQTLSLNSKEIYSLYGDYEGNLWTGTGKGLSHILVNFPVKQFNQFELNGYVTDMELVNNMLYLSTTNGLFKTQRDATGTLQPVKEITSECWDLLQVDGSLVVASTSGLFVLNQSGVKTLLANEPVLRLQKGNRSSAIYAFGTTGVYRFTKGSSGITASGKISGGPGMANSVFELENEKAMYGTFHDGLLFANDTARNVPEELASGEVVLREYNAKMIVQGRENVYVFDGKGEFKKNEALGKLFSGVTNTSFSFDNDCWLLTAGEVRHCVNDQVGVQSPAYGISGKPTAVCKDGKMIWLAFEDKIYKVDKDELRSGKPRVFISQMTDANSRTSFSGFYLDQNGLIQPEETIVPEFNFGETPLKIFFGISSLINPEKNMYSYRIEGVNKNWTRWQKEPWVELSGIRAGKHHIHVKARDACGRASQEIVFDFHVKTPWYMTIGAYVLYGIGFCFLMYLFVILNNRRLLKNNRELEEKVEWRTHELKEEKQKSDELLLNILPAEVAEELKRKGETIARRFDSVTVLFSDFAGFTKWSELLSPEDLVRELHLCFKAFDSIIEKNGLEKIKTIGDAYLAVCGVPVPDEKHALKVIQAAIEIRQFMKTHKEEGIKNGGTYFEARIGVNTGPVIAGIVGVKKYAYDIWGDAVNVAARMEQSGVVGKINISASTYDLVKDVYPCGYRGKIPAKNKGVIDMYFVN